MADKDVTDRNVTGAAASVAAGAAQPPVHVRPVTDPGVLERARAYDELLRQAQPIAVPGSASADAVARAVRAGTAQPRGIARSTSVRYATSSRSPESMLSGANADGKAAEFVVAVDYRALHGRRPVRIVNPPERVATNLHDLRVSPDPSSRKDLIFAYETKDGRILWKLNGQVKTGQSQYVADGLVEMASRPGYGKVGYVDARFVNSDGSPRVAPDGFTPFQAKRLHNAKVRLRGIPDLEQRARRLKQDVETHTRTGLSPGAQQQLLQIRDDIAAAYRSRRIAGRVAMGAGAAAATAAIASLLVQLATGGEVDLKVVGSAAGTGAVVGAGGAAADAALYHAATKLLGQTPELAKAFAQQGVASAFCVLSVGIDILAESRAASRGDVTAAGALGGASLKVAVDLLPLMLGPLGVPGLAVLVGTQAGGRWLVAKAREMDRLLDEAMAADRAFADGLLQRMAECSRACDEVEGECSATDALFALAMKRTSGRPTLH
jgi:hypothetical protein